MFYKAWSLESWESSNEGLVLLKVLSFNNCACAYIPVYVVIHCAETF